MKQANTGICGTGSNAAPSAITSHRPSNLPTRTIGFGPKPFKFGMCERRAYHDNSPAGAPNYTDVSIENGKTHSLGLLTSFLNDEAHRLAMAINIKRAKAEVSVLDQRIQVGPFTLLTNTQNTA